MVFLFGWLKLIQHKKKKKTFNIFLFPNTFYVFMLVMKMMYLSSMVSSKLNIKLKKIYQARRENFKTVV